MGRDLLPGTRVGRWRVVRKLGQGGMGAVYEAEDPELGGHVALKLMLADGPEHARRFEREAGAAAAIRHENVAVTHGIFREGATLVLALELLPGGSLRDLVKLRGPVPWRDAATLGAAIARGLEAIHAAGFVHRDLKPENVLLDRAGRPRITDFGLVRRSPGLSVSEGLTKTGQVLGSIGYMAPEQCEGSKVDARADVYALGATIYHLLVGRPPFEGDSQVVIMKKLLFDAPAAPSSEAQLPRAFDALVLRLLAKAPADRPTVSETVAALEALLESDGAAEATRGRAPWRIAGLVAGAAAVALGGALLATRSTAPATAVAGSSPTPTPTRSQAPTPSPSPILDAALTKRFARVTHPIDSVLGHDEPGHSTGNVRAVVFARKAGKLCIVSGGDDGVLRLWDVSSGEAVGRIPAVGALGGAVRSIGVSADGTRIAAGTRDGRSFVWDLASGRLLQSRDERDGEVAIALSPDGSRALSGGGSRISYWEVETGKDVRAPLKAGQPAWFTRFTSDGKRAAAGFSQGAVVLLDLETGNVIGQSTPRHVDTSEGAFASGDRLVTVGRDHTLVIQRPDLTVEHSFDDIHASSWNVLGVRVFPGGKVAVTGGHDGQCELFDLDEHRVVRSFQAHASYVNAVAVSPEGDLIATAGEDATVRWFDREGKERHPTWPAGAPGHRGRVTSISVSSDGKQVLTSGEDGAVLLWDAASSDVVWSERKHVGAVVGAAFVDAAFVDRPQAKRPGRVVSLGRTDGLRLSTLDPSDPGRAFAPAPGTPAADRLTVSPDGKHAVVLRGYAFAAESFLLGEDPASTGPLEAQAPRAQHEWAAAFSPDSSRIVVADGRVAAIRMLDVATRAEARGWSRGEGWLPFVTLAGDRLFGADNHGKLLCLGDGQQLLWTQPLGAAFPTALAASKDRVAGALDDGEIAIVDARSGRELDRLDLSPAEDSATCLAFDPSGRTLWIGTTRGAVLKVTPGR